MKTDSTIKQKQESQEPRVVGHLGLVGTFMHECGLIDLIDRLIPKKSHNQGHFSYGEVVALMILNGLGYTSKPLYLTHEFFKNKDVEAMLGINFQMEWFNDDIIGRTMDVIHEYGITDLFTALSMQILEYLGKKPSSVNIDSTSFHYHGTEQLYEEEQQAQRKINITYGYSRDAHPELVQVMEQMMVDNETGIPLFMEPEDGNSNDTKAFQRMVKVYENFKKYRTEDCIYLNADSALYSENNIEYMADKNIKFVTRIADGKFKIAQKFITEHCDEELEQIDEKNNGKIYTVEHYGVNQKWLLVHSSAAEARNEHSVESLAKRENDKLNKIIKGYEKNLFSCEADAKKEIEKFKRKCRYCQVLSENIEIIEKAGRGRKTKDPSKQKVTKLYRIQLSVGINTDYCKQVQKNRSYFIIVTNDTEREWTPQELLKQYKSQSKVERGFRFLKDPEFFADSIFVSKNEHIQSLLMIMTLSLAVFSGLEWKLRSTMKEKSVKLRNQVGKEVENITMRRIFQEFEAVLTIIFKTGERIFYFLNSQNYQVLSMLGTAWEKSYGVTT